MEEEEENSSSKSQNMSVLRMDKAGKVPLEGNFIP